MSALAPNWQRFSQEATRGDHIELDPCRRLAASQFFSKCAGTLSDSAAAGREKAAPIVPADLSSSNVGSAPGMLSQRLRD
ncbi:hypothetical protein [Lacipirellula limnantheis]|uniref:hypothetical protein n=1 Tax=Lacipirellula limnantheis TaxID=2528024 RepID=UPI0011A5F0B5|nr:hypothetical protein [Lacipirellula limnantheis]